MKYLRALRSQLESNIPKHNQTNSTVSDAAVGWHIEHSLLTINVIIEALKKSDPAKYKYEFRLPALIVFTLNKIPRGRGKAPKIVSPKNYDSDKLIQHAKLITDKLTELESLPDNCFFLHPYFGNLKTKKAIRFLEIHTKHHLKIIDDILN